MVKETSPFLIKDHNAKTYDGMKLERHSFFGSALHAGEWLASRFALSSGNSPRYPSRKIVTVSCET